MKTKNTFLSLILLALPLGLKAQSAKECLEFLYASMSLPDSIDYSREFYIENINTTLKAKREMTWGQSIPYREFMYFVLPIRVNNENMDNSRMVFYEELKERVKGMSMADAILEVNHWCHERVTYTPSDERTSSPLASIKTAYGRCGEESTLLVAALRSICIPARQVYTPRWAHTDDNHAWVEAWADGEWHFLGACEPEAVLDLGWFNAPASRGLLMHTKVFGNYDGPEEVMQRTPCYTEIDVTSNYAPIAKRNVVVVDEKGKPVKDATVEFKIYNYAEFFTVSSKQTNAQGMTYMQAGKGDILAWAFKDGKYGYAKCSMNEKEPLRIQLNKASGQRYSDDITIVPPVERNTVPYMTDEQRSMNALRLIREDSLRNAYVASFPSRETSKTLADSLGLDPNLVADYILQSRGNYPTIIDFIKNADDKITALKLLKYISAKDLRDISMDVLYDHLNNTTILSNGDELLYKYVLNPRVANEMLTPYKGYLKSQISSSLWNEFSKGPQIIFSWVENNIENDNQHNPQGLRMTPIGVWNCRKTDPVSRDIFFVALCRTKGFPARIDPITGKTEYLDNSSWVEVKFDEESKDKISKGKLKADYVTDEYIINPKYYSHFTVSQIKRGRPILLNYAEDDTWESTLKNGITVDEGDYVVTSGTRLADGSVLAHIEIVPVKAEKTAYLTLKLPASNDALKVIGNFNSENIYKDAVHGNKSLLSTTGRGYFILGFIAPNDEPTNHTLRDIALVKEDFESLGIKSVLLFHNEEDQNRFDAKDMPELPAGTSLGTDIDEKLWNELKTNMHLSSSTLPVFIITDTFNRIVFISQGYIIGLGERLVKNMKSLKK